MSASPTSATSLSNAPSTSATSPSNASAGSATSPSNAPSTSATSPSNASAGSAESRVPCEDPNCNKTFAHQSSLDRHIRDFHEALHVAKGKAKPYRGECRYPHCGKVFYKPYMLREHLVAHENPRCKTAKDYKKLLSSLGITAPPSLSATVTAAGPSSLASPRAPTHLGSGGSPSASVTASTTAGSSSAPPAASASTSPPTTSASRLTVRIPMRRGDGQQEVISFFDCPACGWRVNSQEALDEHLVTCVDASASSGDAPATSFAGCSHISPAPATTTPLPSHPPSHPLPHLTPAPFAQALQPPGATYPSLFPMAASLPASSTSSRARRSHSVGPAASSSSASIVDSSSSTPQSAAELALSLVRHESRRRGLGVPALLAARLHRDQGWAVDLLAGTAALYPTDVTSISGLLGISEKVLDAGPWPRLWR